MQRGRVLALSILAPLLASPTPAAADAAIARRLAALESLVRPDVARAAARAAEPAGFSCGSGWRFSDYALDSRIRAAVRDASLRFLLDPALLRAVIRTESAFDPDAVSSAGAMGLMQLMPATARSLGVVCPFDPRENVLAGARYLRRMRDRLGSWPRALAAYHAGPGRVEQDRIPTVTHHYVRRIMNDWRPGAHHRTDPS